LNQQDYRKLVSGQSTGFGARFLRLVLRAASLGYSGVVRLRNLLYDKGWLRTHRVNAVVLSVGNITAGGTGKTPLVIWLCNLLKQKNIRRAILTRGYKACRAPPRMRSVSDEGGTQTAIRNTLTDEPAILAQTCPEAKIAMNPDRVAGAMEMVNMFGAEALVMDDGFQHRHLARDLDIVTIDATVPFGYGRLLPAGLLREPVTALKRADAAVITRCDQIGEAELSRLEEKLRFINSDMIITKSIHAPVCVKYPEPSAIPAKAGIQKDAEGIDSRLRRNDSLDRLKGKRIFAFCGIGNPKAFLTTIETLGGVLAGSRIYDDHHHYSRQGLAEICHQAKQSGAELILTTEKDYCKIATLQMRAEDVSLAYLVVRVQFTAGQDQLTALIESTIAGKIPDKPEKKDQGPKL
jgi:tetraacyldisaccharide 4'-kinase